MAPKVHPLPLRRLDKMAWLLDNSIKLPGIDYRIGVDGIIGLIPGIGDATGTLLSMYILAEGARARLPRSILLRMAWNIAVDTLIGAVPVIGDVFDATWKANVRNVRLIKEYSHTSHGTVTRSRWFLVALAAALLLVLVLAGLLTYILLRQLWSLLLH
jgi:hypothetical protein